MAVRFINRNYVEVEMAETPWGLTSQVRPRRKRSERGGSPLVPRKAQLFPLRFIAPIYPPH